MSLGVSFFFKSLEMCVAMKESKFPSNDDPWRKGFMRTGESLAVIAVKYL